MDMLKKNLAANKPHFFIYQKLKVLLIASSYTKQLERGLYFFSKN
jgi:hypothetical protein